MLPCIYLALGSKTVKPLVISRVFSLYIGFLWPSHYKATFPEDLWLETCVIFVHRFITLFQGKDYTCTNSPTLPELMETGMSFRETPFFHFGSSKYFAPPPPPPPIPIPKQGISEGAVLATWLWLLL